MRTGFCRPLPHRGHTRTPTHASPARTDDPTVRAAVTATALILLTACGPAGHGAERRPASTGPAAASPTTQPAEPVVSAEQRALEAYEQMWAAYDRAGRAPAADPDDAALAVHADGRALRLLTAGLRSLREQGLVIDGRVELNPVVVELSTPGEPTLARIEDCGDSSGWLTVDARTGQVSDEPRGRQLVIATVAVVDGQWKVTDFAVRGVGSCG